MSTVAIAAALCLGVASAASAIWPQRGFDPQRTSRSPNVGPQGPDVTTSWIVKTPGAVQSSPAIGADGTVYAGTTNGFLLAVNGTTGDKLFNVSVGSFLYSSPAVASDGTVIIGSFDFNLYGVDGQTGDIKWTYSMGKAIQSSPVLAPDDMVIIGSENGMVAAVDGTTGKVLWKVVVCVDGGGSLYASPALSNDNSRVYIACYNAGMFGLNRQTGKIDWTTPLKNVMSSPAVGLEDTVFIGSDDNCLHALHGATGALLWKYETNNDVESVPSTDANGVVYFGSNDGNLYALDGPTGTLLWQFEAGGYVWSAPGLSPDGTVYIGAADGSVYGLDSADGSVIWRYTAGGVVVSSPAIGPDGTLYIGAEDGLYAIADAISMRTPALAAM